MTEFLTNILAFPALPLTVAMGVVLLYWIFVIVGAVGLDALDGSGDAVAGGVKGAGEAVSGALKGMGEAASGLKGVGEATSGALKGVGEAAAHAGEQAAGAAKGAASAAHDAVQGGGIFSLLGLGNVPVTISVSSVIFFAWVTTVFASRSMEGFGLLPRIGVLLGAFVVSLMASSLALRPLNRIFTTARPASREDVVGKLCTITSGKVEADFGTAIIDDGAAGLNVHVVCNKQNGLKKGDRALLVTFDAQREVYEIEPLDWLEPAEQEALKDPARAQSVIASKIRVR
jgi:hypothetical protein